MVSHDLLTAYEHAMTKPIILASSSKVRAEMLSQAGLSFETVPARIDETAIKNSLTAENAKPNDIADALAEYKALKVALKNPDALVIGSDQLLVCEGAVFDKAETVTGAIDHLKQLRGKPHTLLSAAVIFEDGKPVWRTVGRAQLFMRELSDGFIETYAEKHGNSLCSSVGCYFLESDGVTLFNRIQGDYFTVLGFPLLDVLNFLRTRGIGAE